MIDFSSKFEIIKEQLENIKKHETILVISHSDADGITSAYIFAKLLETYGLEYEKDYRVWIVDNQFRYKIKENEQMAKIINKNDYIFFLDFALDNYNVIDNKKVFVIDHHASEGKPYLSINPLNIEPDNKVIPSASALVYNLYRYVRGNHKTVQKVGFLGALGDLMLFESLPYLDVRENDKEYFIQKLPHYIYNHMFKIFNLMNIEARFGKEIFEYMKDNIEKNMLPMLILPKEYEDMLNKFEQNKSEVLRKLVDNLEIHKEEKTIFSYLGDKNAEYFDSIKNILHMIYSSYSTYLIKKLPDNLGYKISGRSDIINLRDMIGNIKEEIEGMQGGGHPFASGMYVKPNDLETLKKKILEKQNKFLIK